LFRTVDFCTLGGIDSIAEDHWTIDFRRSIFGSSAQEL